MIQLAILDDHAIARHGLKAILENEKDIEVVFESSDGNDFLEFAKHRNCDILMLDIEMDKMNGMEVLERINILRPKLKVIILTVHDTFPYMQNALNKGAVGYIVKHDLESDIVSTIRTVWSGRIKISENILGYSDGENHFHLKYRTLTTRETEIVKLSAQGLSTKSIAKKLEIGARTVEGHRSRIYRKLGIRSMADMIRHAREWGITNG